jgi:anti-anti-sigma factor
MEVKARVEQGVVVLDLSGSIDVNSANLVEVVGQCLRDGYKDILCNFEDVESADYLGVSAIILAYKEVTNAGGRMRFVNLPRPIKNIFSVTGLEKVIEYYATEQLALQSFKEDKIIDNIKKMQLRRRFKRLPIDIKVELKDKYNKSASCLKVDILNLSAVGAYIYGCEGFKLGDEVIMKVILPPQKEELELEARVVWLCDKQVQPQHYPGIGVAFYNISRQNQAKIVEFVERNVSLSPTDGD